MVLAGVCLVGHIRRTPSRLEGVGWNKRTIHYMELNVRKLSLLALFAVLFSSSCFAGLTDYLIDRALSDDKQERLTASIVLSNLTLSQSQVDVLAQSLKKRSDASQRQYLLTFILAKRTQEDGYISQFIQLSAHNIAIYLQNDSGWVSITNPVLDYLVTLAFIRDDALVIVLKQVKNLDGAVLTAVSDSLNAIAKADADRFDAACREAGVSWQEILSSVEE